MRPRESLQVSGIDFKGPFLCFFKFSLEIINYSASNSRIFRINGKFVISSTVESGNCPLFLCCQYITVGSQH